MNSTGTRKGAGDLPSFLIGSALGKHQIRDIETVAHGNDASHAISLRHGNIPALSALMRKVGNKVYLHRWTWNKLALGDFQLHCEPMSWQPSQQPKWRTSMKALTYFVAIAAFAAVPFTAALAQATMSEEECTALIQKADKNADGSLGGAEAEKYLERITKTDVKLSDATIIKQEEFMLACAKGTFSGMAAE